MSDKKITLKTARLIAGYTQKELGELVGVHSQTIYDWENNPGKVPISSARKIIQILNADYDIFFNKNSTKRR